ncbi:MAG: M48 family metalloprotease [Proteobacteria bacterium]|nr:M48 family metalloprotease [Pseudomonadota bacterium]
MPSAVALLRARMTRSLVALASVIAIIGNGVPPAAAQQKRQISFIRDAEIEQVMRDYLDPLLGAAGLRKGFIRVVLVNDRSFNAFVADGKRVFVNIGAIMDSTTPNQIIGVLAHETGHIAGGHLARLRSEVDKATAIAVIGSILGAAAVIGSAQSRQVGANSEGMMGAIFAGPEMARRTLLAYQRTEEQAADKAGLAYLEKTGQSGKGMLETFERMANESLFSASRMDKYLQSHPMPQDRVASLRESAPKSAHFEKKDSPVLQLKHDMIRAKLFAFTAPATETARRYPAYNTTLPARYARAISDYRFGKPDQALKAIDALIREQPANPYFWELKGQALLEAGQAGAAVAPLRKAVALAPNQPLIRTMLGHALVAQETPQSVAEAIRELSNATSRDPDNYEGFRYLGQAYARRGDEGNAALAAARGALIEGQFQDAQRFARRALPLLPPNSPAYLAAKDIAEAKPEKNQ